MPLDVDALLGELDDPAAEPFDGLPAGTTMGHVHLQVAAIPETVAFYRDLIGFELMASYGSQAVFLAAGGYHHHLGANTWESAGAVPPPPGTAALRQATIVLPDAAERDRVLDRLDTEPEETEAGSRVTDPSGIELVLAVADAWGYMEGPAADEAERRLDELERGVEVPTEERLAVFGSTADDPEKHFIGWRDDVDPDELFATGKAWGISVVRRPAD